MTCTLLLKLSLSLKLLHQLIKRNAGAFVFSLFNGKIIGGLLKRFVDIDVIKHLFKELAHRDSMVFRIKPQKLSGLSANADFHN